VFYPGAAMNSKKVKIFQQGSAAGAFPELAAGAYPGAITSDTITFYGIFGGWESTGALRATARAAQSRRKGRAGTWARRRTRMVAAAPIAKRFGCRLAALGWVRDDAWTPYCFRLRANQK
jgi:hypothetical protein